MGSDGGLGEPYIMALSQLLIIFSALVVVFLSSNSTALVKYGLAKSCFTEGLPS